MHREDFMSMKSKLKRSSFTRILFVSLLAVGLAVASLGTAQAAYPERPITLIVPDGSWFNVTCCTVEASATIVTVIVCVSYPNFEYSMS